MKNNSSMTASYQDGTMFLALAIVELIICLVGTLGNSLICMAVARRRKMRVATNLFVVSLAVADLLVTAFLVPVRAAQHISIYHQAVTFPAPLLQAAVLVGRATILASVANLAALSIDRLLAFKFPIRYRTRIRHSWGFAPPMICTVWGVSVLLTSISEIPGVEARVGSILFTAFVFIMTLIICATNCWVFVLVKQFSVRLYRSRTVTSQSAEFMDTVRFSQRLSSRAIRDNEFSAEQRHFSPKNRSVCRTRESLHGAQGRLEEVKSAFYADHDKPPCRCANDHSDIYHEENDTKSSEMNADNTKHPSSEVISDGADIKSTQIRKHEGRENTDQLPHVGELLQSEQCEVGIGNCSQAESQERVKPLQSFRCLSPGERSLRGVTRPPNIGVIVSISRVPSFCSSSTKVANTDSEVPVVPFNCVQERELAECSSTGSARTTAAGQSLDKVNQNIERVVLEVFLSGESRIFRETENTEAGVEENRDSSSNPQDGGLQCTSNRKSSNHNNGDKICVMHQSNLAHSKTPNQKDAEPRNHSQTSQRNVREQQHERAIAKMIAIVIGAFALFVYPRIALMMYHMARPQTEAGNLARLWLRALLYTNSILNPFLYAWRLPVFREEFKDILTFCCGPPFAVRSRNRTRISKSAI